jgi:hypothetical protein
LVRVLLPHARLKTGESGLFYDTLQRRVNP